MNRKVRKKQTERIKDKSSDHTGNTVSMRYVEVPGAELRLQQAMGLLLDSIAFPQDSIPRKTGTDGKQNKQPEPDEGDTD